MEDGNLFVQAGASGAANVLVSANPCTLLGVWFDNTATDPSVFPLTIELVDEAATADIDSNSKTLYRKTFTDPAGVIEAPTFALKAGKGICIKMPACGTNDAKLGVTWR